MRWPILLFFICTPISANAQERLRLATTTSVQDSGLLPYLLPAFENRCKCKVDVIAVGTGQALKLAANGDVDMVLVHDPEAEEKFINEGLGVYRHTFMVNDFILIGPQSDPAGIRGMKDAAKAMARIQRSGSLFISRGDASGTHQREKTLWQKAKIEPQGSWYLEIGQGMGAVLTMTNEKGGYTICDRATYLMRKSRIKLQVLVEGDPVLINYYSAMYLNPKRYPSAKYGLSRRLIDWLCSDEGQKLIGDYSVDGLQLFKPSYVRGK